MRKLFAGATRGTGALSALYSGRQIWLGLSGVALFAMFCSASSVSAADVKVTGVHMCCGGCVKAVTRALSEVNGVTDVAVDQDEETVTYKATDDATAQKGLKALAESGLYGKPSVAGPDFKVSADKAAGEVKITKLHLCCKGCVDAVEGPLKKVDGVTSVRIDQKQGAATLTGKGIRHAAILKTLHESGFHGKIE